MTAWLDLALWFLAVCLIMALDSLLGRIPSDHDFIRRLSQRSLRGAAIGAGLALLSSIVAYGFGYFGGFVVIDAIDAVAKSLGAGDGQHLGYLAVAGSAIGLVVGLVSALLPTSPRVVDG